MDLGYMHANINLVSYKDGWMNEYNMDIFGMVETNVNQSIVKNTDKIWERAQGLLWFEGSQLSDTYNSTYKLANDLPYGGVINMTQNRIFYQAIGKRC